MQYLYRNDSIDTDFYKFEIGSEGDLNVETVAQRLQNASLLDTKLVLYNGQFQPIASNDDYFDDDSFIGVHLQPGTYYIGVSSTGNSQYGPDVDGGTTEGAYQLRMDFQPKVAAQITDARGTPLDGDADGVPGGQYNYWFNVQTAVNTLVVDKLAADGGNGALAAPYNNIDGTNGAFSAVRAKQAVDPNWQGIVRVVGNNFANDDQGNGIQAVAGSLLADGKTFTISDANRTFTFELDSNNTFTRGNVQVPFQTTDSAATVATKLAAAINSVSWIPYGLGQTTTTRYTEGLYARATLNGSHSQRGRTDGDDQPRRDQAEIDSPRQLGLRNRHESPRLHTQRRQKTGSSQGHHADDRRRRRPETQRLEHLRGQLDRRRRPQPRRHCRSSANREATFTSPPISTNG